MTVYWPSPYLYIYLANSSPDPSPLLTCACIYNRSLRLQSTKSNSLAMTGAMASRDQSSIPVHTRRCTYICRHMYTCRGMRTYLIMGFSQHAHMYMHACTSLTGMRMHGPWPWYVSIDYPFAIYIADHDRYIHVLNHNRRLLRVHALVASGS